MTDRTSYSYRADMPGSNPDMYQIGGKAREAFKQERMSPYIARQSQSRDDGSAQNIAEMKQAKTKIMSQRKKLTDLDKRRSPQTVVKDEKDFAGLKQGAEQIIDQSQRARAKAKFLEHRKAPTPTLTPNRAR